MGLKRRQTKPKINGTVPTNRHTTIPNDDGPISASFDDDPKRPNCEIAQPRQGPFSHGPGSNPKRPNCEIAQPRRGLFKHCPGSSPNPNDSGVKKLAQTTDRRRNTPKSAQNRSESLSPGLSVPCRVFWAWFGAALGPKPVRNRRFPAGSLKVFRALWCRFAPGRTRIRTIQGSRH